MTAVTSTVFFRRAPSSRDTPFFPAMSTANRTTVSVSASSRSQPSPVEPGTR